MDMANRQFTDVKIGHRFTGDMKRGTELFTGDKEVSEKDRIILTDDESIEEFTGDETWHNNVFTGKKEYNSSNEI